jgi:hypothetical protein
MGQFKVNNKVDRMKRIARIKKEKKKIISSFLIMQILAILSADS